MILSVRSASFDFIPNGYDDIDTLKSIQGLAHQAGVGDPRPALHPVAYGDRVIIPISGVHVSIAVAGGSQAGYEGSCAIIPSPGKPAKIA